MATTKKLQRSSASAATPDRSVRSANRGWSSVISGALAQLRMVACVVAICGLGWHAGLISWVCLLFDTPHYLDVMLIDATFRCFFEELLTQPVSDPFFCQLSISSNSTNILS
jgi:hypothetical protein